MTSSSVTSSTVGGVPLSGRSLAPDLARGVMLLVIAIAHATILWHAVIGPGSPEQLRDVVANAFVVLFVDARGYPMFAALFGYGLARIHARRTEEGRTWPWVRSLVRRRGRWMLLIGFLHVALLFFGDIVFVYGLVALLFVGLLSVSDRRLLTHGFLWLGIGTLIYGAGLALSADPEQTAGIMTNAPLQDLVMRLVTFAGFAPLMLTTTVFPFVVGVWAGRRRLLEEPEKHLRLLRRVAFLGIPLSVLGGVPFLLTDLTTWNTLPVLATGWLYVACGYLGGFGYAALIALVAVRLGNRRGPVVRALVATGQRSMSSYLLQSVCWSVVFLPYLLDLAPRLNAASAVGVGAAVWLFTVVVAELMRRAGVRGPAETFLRRRTYAEPRSAETTTEEGR